MAWNPADQALTQLKNAFTSSPILRHPDPSKPFIVEVDVSETGVGTILSQRYGERPKMHLVAFYSKKLSPLERNYSIGEHELLAVKLALEEWHH